MTEEEIAHSLEEGVDAGVIEQHEHQMVQNVFHLDDRPLTSMMVPRSDIEWLDAGLDIGQCLRQVGRDGAHSWYPVCRGSLDDVLGVVSVARLLSLGPDDPSHRRVARRCPRCSCPKRCPAWNCSSSSARSRGASCSWSTNTAWCRA